jgi:hypothetical protein
VGGFRCFVTDDSPRFGMLASRFLGFEVEPPTRVAPDELSRPPGQNKDVLVGIIAA